MQHPFDDLKAEYAGDMAHMVLTRPLDIDRAAKRVLGSGALTPIGSDFLR